MGEKERDGLDGKKSLFVAFVSLLKYSWSGEENEIEFLSACKIHSSNKKLSRNCLQSYFNLKLSLFVLLACLLARCFKVEAIKASRE